MGEEADASPLSRSSLVDGAYGEIRSRILDGRIPPGSRITVRPIADQLRLSATPIKAALVRLEREGLISAQLHRGFFVPNLGGDDMREIYELREALDPVAAYLAASGEHAVYRATSLADLCDAQAAHLARGDIDAYRQADIVFHRTLWQVSGNSRILRAGEPLLDQMLLGNALSARRPGRGAESVEEHRDIVVAIGRGESDAAAALARDHIRRSHRSFAAAIAE